MGTNQNVTEPMRVATEMLVWVARLEKERACLKKERDEALRERDEARSHMTLEKEI